MAPVANMRPLHSSPPPIISEDMELASSASQASVPELIRDYLPDESAALLDRSVHELYVSRSDSVANKLLTARQSQQTQPIIVPTTYINSHPGANSGEVVGIVLGVVFGILIVLYILMQLRANPLRPVVGTSSVTDVSRYRGDRADGRSRTARVKSGGRRTARSRSKSAVSRDEMSEVQAPPRRERGNQGRSPRRARERVIVEESRRASRPPPPLEEYDEDVIEVMEEESDYSAAPRSHLQPGYRNVDPDGYGGGPRSIRSVRR